MNILPRMDTILGFMSFQKSFRSKNTLEHISSFMICFFSRKVRKTINQEAFGNKMIHCDVLTINFSFPINICLSSYQCFTNEH